MLCVDTSVLVAALTDETATERSQSSSQERSRLNWRSSAFAHGEGARVDRGGLPAGDQERGRVSPASAGSGTSAWSPPITGTGKPGPPSAVALLLFVVLLAAGREVVWTHPICLILLPAAIVVAAFFYYPLAPTAGVLAVVFVASMLWPA